MAGKRGPFGGRGRDDGEKAPKITKAVFRRGMRIIGFIRPYSGWFFSGMFFLVFSSVTSLTFPYLIGRLIDIAVPGSANVLPTGVQRPETTWIAGMLGEISIGSIIWALIIILALQAIFSFLRVYTFAQLTERSLADLRIRLYAKTLRLPYAFFEKSRVGELMSRITADVQQLQEVMSVSVAELFRQAATLLIGTALVFMTSMELTLFMMATFPLLVLSAVIFGRFIRRQSKKTQELLGETNTIVEETFQNIHTVKSYTRERFEEGRYSGAIRSVVQTALKTATLRGGFISFIIFALFGAILLVIWRGANLLQAGELQIGELTAFVVYTMFIGGSVGGLGDTYSQIMKAIGASDRIFEILDTEEEPAGNRNRTATAAGGLTFQDVQFAYPSRPDVQVLRGISFSINPGEKVALVGPSGAGKTTIFQLILRMYQPQEGMISISGSSIQDIALQQYRGTLAIVPQEILLFGGSIRENIAYGREGATEDEIIQAAHQANAWEFISRLPEGLDTIVGERGLRLSGGQRQRIAIARAILKKPMFLLLDEATSSLDSESEHLVQEALERLMQGCTTLIIAHRLSTIRNVDRILVLDQGTVTESGNHESLIRNGEGMYRHLVELQFRQT